MRNPSIIYESNPNRVTERPLRINILKKNISLKVVFQSVDGKYVTNWFVPNTPENSEQFFTVPDFHVCENVEESVRKFLQHIPIHDTWIEVWRED